MADAIGLVRGQALARRPRYLAALSFLSPLVTAAAPRLTWLFLPLLAACVLWPLLRGGDWRTALKPSGALVLLVLVAAYVGLSALWGADPGGAAEKGLLVLGAALVSFAAAAAIPHCEETELRRAALAFALGTLCAALFVLFEIATDAAATRFLLNHVALLKPSSFKHMTAVDGRITKIKLSELNQNVAIVTLCLWPGLLALRAVEDRVRRLAAGALLLAPIAAAILLSDHQSSQLALLFSVPAFLLARRWPGAVLRTLAALWCLGFVLVLPADFLAYRAGLHLAPWMPTSFKARIIIWEYTAERVLERPLLGVGATSTPLLAESRETADKPEGFVYPRNTGRHAHDLFLQTWYELGLIGVLLVALAGAAIALRLLLLPLAVQPFAAAAFATVMGMASFAWGMWQTWLVCAVGLVALYFGLAAEGARGCSAGIEPGGSLTRPSEF